MTIYIQFYPITFLKKSYFSTSDWLTFKFWILASIKEILVIFKAKIQAYIFQKYGDMRIEPKEKHIYLSKGVTKN